MKNNWPVKKLGEVAEVYGGGTPRRSISEYWDNDVPWLTMEDINSKFYVGGTVQYISNLGLEKSNAQLVPSGSVVISSTASVGNVAINTIPLATNQQFNSFHPKEALNAEFLAYYLIFDKERIKRLGGSTTFQFISKTTISNYGIPIPPMIIQKKIVEKLDTVRRVQELCDQEIQKIEELIESVVFKYVQNSISNRAKLGEVCKYEGGTQPPKSTFISTLKEGYIRLLQIRDYKSDKDAVYIPVKERHKTCTEDDIMIGRYGPPVFQILRGKVGAYNVALIKCNPDKKFLLNDWLFYFLRTTPVQDKIIGLSMRARQWGVNPADLDNLEIPLPSLSEQQEVIEKLNAIQEHKKLLLRERELLKELFDSVLNKCMRGEV